MKKLPRNQIIQGDCLEVMRSFPDKSIDLIVTSPPYNCGKEYEKELTDEKYYEFILPIVEEFARILKPDGRFAINIIFNINRITETGNRLFLTYSG